MKMYDQLNKAVTRFQSEENIRECFHKHDTQVNERLNMSVSRYVPKFEHFMIQGLDGLLVITTWFMRPTIKHC